MNSTFFNRTKRALAQERLDAYAQDGADQRTILARYLWNIAVSEALYSPLQLTEIALRNGVHRGLANKFGDDWYDKAPLNSMQVEQIDKAKKSIKCAGNAIEAGRIVAELSFGFWTACFNNDALSSGVAPAAAKKTFPKAPPRERAIPNLHKRFQRIRKLRNRVFHHERIIHWQDLAQQHQNILLILGWMSPELAEIEAGLDRFTTVYSARIEPWKTQISNHWPPEDPS